MANIHDILNNTRFGLARKGYDPKQVDDFVEAVRDEVARMENRMKKLNEKYVKLQDAQEKLIELREQAEDALAHAEKEAERRKAEMLEEAEEQASIIRGGIDSASATEIIDKQAFMWELEGRLADAREAYGKFRAEMMQLLDIPAL